MYQTDLFGLLGACLLLLVFAIYADAVSLSNVLNVEDQARLKQIFYNAMPFKDLETAGYAVFSLKLMKAEVPPTQVIGKIFVYKHCFCYFNVQNIKREFFVSPANSFLVGILITIDDVTDIFAINGKLVKIF